MLKNTVLPRQNCCLREEKPMWRNGRRNGLKIRWAVNGPCRFESGHRHAQKTILRGKLIITFVESSQNERCVLTRWAASIRFPMEIRPFLVTVGTSLCGLILLVVNVRGDVDPARVGTWETSGVNANGPWKLIWEIRPDSSYFLSGAVSDSGIIGSGDGKW